MNDINQAEDKDLEKAAGGNNPERVYHFTEGNTFVINEPFCGAELIQYTVEEDKYAKIGDTVYCHIMTQVNGILVYYKYKNVAVSELLACPNKPSGFEC